MTGRREIWAKRELVWPGPVQYPAHPFPTGLEELVNRGLGYLSRAADWVSSSDEVFKVEREVEVEEIKRDRHRGRQAETDR